MHVHIGLHKTGTTTIQAGLRLNEKLLNKHGILYPKKLGNAHHNICWEIRQEKRFTTDRITIAELNQMIASYRDENILISTEDLCFLTPEQIDAFLAAFPNVEVYIILYLRNQNSLAQSMYSQMTKNGHFLPKFPRWLEKRGLPDRRLAFDRLIADWEARVGRDHMRVALLEDARGSESILHHFLQTTGLPVDTSRLQVPDNKNISPSFRTIETIRQVSMVLKKQGLNRPTIFAVAKHLQDYADDHGWNNEKVNVVDAQTQQLIIETFAEGNAKVAREYFGRDALFPPPKPTTELSSAPSMDTQEFGELMAFVMDKLLTLQ